MPGCPRYAPRSRCPDLRLHMPQGRARTVRRYGGKTARTQRGSSCARAHSAPASTCLFFPRRRQKMRAASPQQRAARGAAPSSRFTGASVHPRAAASATRTRGSAGAASRVRRSSLLSSRCRPSMSLARRTRRCRLCAGAGSASPGMDIDTGATTRMRSCRAR